MFRLLGLCDFPFQQKNKGTAGCWLHSHCCRFPHQFWTGSKICSSGSSATSRLYCWYFVTLARLLLLPCYYPYKKQTILYIAADNFLDRDLILFRKYIYIYIYIYSASGGVLEGDDGLLSGWDQCIRNGSTLSVPSYSRDSWHREPIYVTIFLAQRFTERFGTVVQTPTLHGDISAQLPTPQKKRSRAVPPVSHFQNVPKSRPVAPRAKATRERSQKNDKGKGTSPPKSLNRQCKGMLSTREKVKLDVE